jgi:N-acetylglutamate synthase
MSYNIREMQPQDYQAAIHLWQILPGIGLSSADKEEALLAFLAKNPRTCFTAFDGDSLIGTILGGSDGRRGYLYHLAVHNDYQKQGLGRQLVQTCLQALKAEGIEKSHIFVLADNQDGMIFWHKEGWQKRDDILVMSKNL